MRNKVVVVIPVHSEFPSGNELISFQQCYSILRDHPIKIIAPVGLNLEIYKKVEPKLDVIYIPQIWQSSITMYNKLKLSKYFYKLFNGFDFLLTYELDAFVFRDELQYWCDKGYDYIGAPWFEGFEHPVSENFEGVGNSGFSLRKIKTMKKALGVVYKQQWPTYVKDKKLSVRGKSGLYHLINNTKENPTIQNAPDIKEDWFISKVIVDNIHGFKLASVEDAVKFSFEVNPGKLFKMNGDTLPMGCHAWCRYDIEFWKPHIEKFGYDLKI